jgi:hypothetical protein
VVLLDECTAIVTGATSGLGRASERGWRSDGSLLGHDRDKAASTRAEALAVPSLAPDTAAAGNAALASCEQGQREAPRDHLARTTMDTGKPVRRMGAMLSLGLAVAAGSPATDAQAPDALKVDAASFRCIRKMTPVRHFYVDNLVGDSAGTLAAANAPKGAIYPPGSVVQLVPTEAMVKREKGFSPATGDWEFFELEVSDSGSKIRTRGFADVNNRFGKNCFACHVPAREPWDFICESGHGCEPIPIDRAMTGALQRSDPRCGAPAPQSGDTWALIKLRALVVIGTIIGWVKGGS